MALWGSLTRCGTCVHTQPFNFRTHLRNLTLKGGLFLSVTERAIADFPLILFVVCYIGPQIRRKRDDD